MRSIWLASAAIIMTAGIAAAQTSPPPTGATNAAPQAPSGSAASPGNMGTGNNAGPVAASGGTSTTQSSSGMGTPAPTGAAQAAQESPNPNASPGNMAPAGSTSAAAANPAPSTGTSSTASNAPASNVPASTVASAKPAHHGMGGMMMPENASADRYLHIASDAIKHHNKNVADDALSHAETRLLTRAVPASGGMTDQSPRVGAIENARHALASSDYQTAADDTRQAMHGHMGGMHDGMSNGMSNGNMTGMDNASTTSGQTMPGAPMSNASASGTSAGSGK